MRAGSETRHGRDRARTRRGDLAASGQGMRTAAPAAGAPQPRDPRTLSGLEPRASHSQRVDDPDHLVPGAIGSARVPMSSGSLAGRSVGSVSNVSKEPPVPQRASAPIGAPCWVDLFTSDPDKSRAFYGELFGWTAEEAGEEYGGYVNFLEGGQSVAGCMRNDGESGMPDVWSVYLATDDARATADAAVANGGQVGVPAMEVMDLGSMAVMIDAGGAAIGAWQPGRHHGFGVFGEPGTPTWFELHTRD